MVHLLTMHVLLTGQVMTWQLPTLTAFIPYGLQFVRLHAHRSYAPCIMLGHLACCVMAVACI